MGANRPGRFSDKPQPLEPPAITFPVRLSILPPRSRAGESISLRAEMDLIVGLTACSAEMSNNYKFKSIAYEVSVRDAARPG